MPNHDEKPQNQQVLRLFRAHQNCQLVTAKALKSLEKENGFTILNVKQA
jgi:hypothetical protein